MVSGDNTPALYPAGLAASCAPTAPPQRPRAPRHDKVFLDTAPSPASFTPSALIPSSRGENQSHSLHSFLLLSSSCFFHPVTLASIQSLATGVIAFVPSTFLCGVRSVCYPDQLSVQGQDKPRRCARNREKIPGRYRTPDATVELSLSPSLASVCSWPLLSCPSPLLSRPPQDPSGLQSHSKLRFYLLSPDI